ncbi:amidohydrolase family protein [Actinomadura parmotrematis]|uniref:Amidohydrolase family protein n=1 Tax=Actinomadura parmotrematis TaxID=2864039 RepID=A0ABS7FTX1_9ACTN|nr:amidohydrolase family protein [Actinomadura parmotrematis]MBW8482993.1 amidohydrolase family protein [Actinomadura parmotrematis]
MADEPEFVDTHVHYWRPSANDWYPGLRGGPLHRDVLPGAFPAPPRQVHVSAVTDLARALDEARWLDALRAETGVPTAVIGTIDPAAPWADTERLLFAQAESPAFRGVRVFSGLDPAGPVARSLFALLGERGWVHDLIARPADVPALLPALDAAPGTSFVLEHAGWPDGEAPEQFRAWRAAVAEVAARGNVDCKISGLGMALQTTDATRLRPFVETCIELFGVDRCFFGSNFPVDGLAGTYEEIIGAYRAITAGLSAADRAKLWSGNARRRYGLEA